MFDTPKSSNLEDFRQRYQRSYGVFTTTSGQRIVVLVTRVGSSGVEFTDVNGARYVANVDSGVEFEFLQVPRGWYNTYSGPVLLLRKPARQWSRGICDGNTMVLIPNQQRITQVPVGFESLTPLINADQVKVAEKGNTAYSRNFARVGSNVYLLDKKVGSIINGTHVVHPMVAQELQDLFKRTNYQGVVRAGD